MGQDVGPQVKESVNHTAPQSTQKGPSLTKNDFTILVADDNAVVRLFFREILSQAGYEVLLAEHGEAAVDLLRERGRHTAQACHMALLDVRMPKQSGVELLRRIRTGEVLGAAADMPIYMVTASALCDEEELRGSAQADGVLLKPMQAGALLELVNGIYAVWRQQTGSAKSEDIVESDTTCPYNKSAALQGLDNNEALLHMLMTAFIPEATARRVRVAEALGCENAEQVRILREEAHALANSAGVLCCEELLHSAKSLEKAAIVELENPSDRGAVSPHAQAMLNALDAVLDALIALQANE